MHSHRKQNVIIGLTASGLFACSSFSALATDLIETKHALGTYATDNGALYLSESRPGQRSIRAHSPMPGNRSSRAADAADSTLEVLIFPSPTILADSDADGVADGDDAFPFDPNESIDTDNDGVGNNADEDDDNDGTIDINDDFPFNPARTKPIEPQFPEVNGVTDFPDHITGNQFEWIMQQLAASSTSLQDIQDRFVAGFNFVQIQQFFDTLRAAYPNAKVIEAINVTAKQAQVIIGDPTMPQTIAGFIDLRTQFSDGKINFFSAQNFPQFPSSTFLADQNLTLQQAGDRVASLAEGTSVLVGRINPSNQCESIFSMNAHTPRATGSIFKAWVLGAVAEGVQNGTLSPDQNLALEANELVPVGGAINNEPLGTLFSVTDMANMMMGTSDNTATDHLHEFVGRAAAENALSVFDHATPSAMTPFLSINETFHLYWSVPEADALAFAAGTDAEQIDYMNNVLVPLGPVTSFPMANGSVLVDGTWQASPMDVCNVMAGMRQYNDTTAEFEMVDQAYGANAGAWQARRNWERVWFKGGSLGDPAGLLVLTYGWMVESDDRGAYVIIGMANTQSSNPGRIDSNAFLSAMSRMVDIITEEY